MSRDPALFHPEYVPEPYWWAAARPGTDHSTALPPQTEVLIVGGGYAGLSAAIELARHGHAATVVEAEEFGYGASSRNGGGVSAGVNLGKGISGGPGQKKDNADRLERLLAESAESLKLVETLIEREKIDCHYERSGRYLGAYTPEHFKGFAAKSELLNRVTNGDTDVLPPDRQREEIASDFYHGGLVIRRSGKLHPALFHKGLLDAAARAGVTLCAKTKATRISGSVGNFSIETSGGICRAEQVVIATNGYTGGLTPSLRNRLVPVKSHIIATEELPTDQVQSLIPHGRTISETPRVLNYYRQSPDMKRVIFGGRPRFTDVGADVTAALLHEQMTDRFPQLNGTRITHSWSGTVAFTNDHIPHLGREAGMHYALGCNGSGVGMLTYLGYQIARRIIQGGTSDSAYEGLELPLVPVPFYNGNPWFLPIVGGYYRFLDRLDRRR